MSNLIIEVPVYCGARKVWRTLNLNTGTVYSVEHPTEQAAFNAVERGEIRAGGVVRPLKAHDLLSYLDIPSILAAAFEQRAKNSRSPGVRKACREAAADLRRCTLKP